ncbi:hypothetical protein NTGBS_660014 [Candidatus Nitrotoga sp. BS]|uniref:hypothetical protein n=1 Tax=Candidatus Nitrotoga sp. BS TaxID=2890408 RepID=UPI001EF31BB3|nr:hypothetical protein [Candidatus Nitrotoga sp. BS]CAH1206633.1 hypothetical protein NTGBS_660014 [Candidatus Nitrotoga sp. BS]
MVVDQGLSTQVVKDMSLGRTEVMSRLIEQYRTEQLGKTGIENLSLPSSNSYAN